MSIRGSSTRRTHYRQTIMRGRPPCALCGEPIDYSLPHGDPGEFTIDHIIPIARGGPDTLSNLQAAHRECNRRKGAGVESGEIVRSMTLTH